MKFLFQMLPSQLPLVILSCFVIAITCQQHVSENLPDNETVAAVIVFGDFIVDTGNNNFISTVAKCNFPPYGRDFARGNQPTGRFSNGLVPSDIIAAKFGVKELLPAYLDPNLQLQDLLTGVSFASGVCNITLRSIGQAQGVHKEDKGSSWRKQRTATLIPKSIYIVCVGSDDIANTYTQTPFRRAQYDIPSYTDLMASQASNFLEELYGLGARRIGVISLPILGCVPSQRTIGGGTKGACSDSENQAAILFNIKLFSQMEYLKEKFPEARLVYLNICNPLNDIIQNPAKYGFEVADKGCCGTGTIKASILCNPLSINTCSNASNYIFWDSYNPTEKAYKVLTSMVLDNKIMDFF